MKKQGPSGFSVLGWAAVAAGAGALFVLGCGSDDSSAGKGGASSSAQSTGQGSTASSQGFTCDPACIAPQFCSVHEHCLDPGACDGDEDCKGGKVCDTATSQCIPGGGCGQQVANTTPVPPNLLIVLDRSCSMKQQIGGVSKWEIAVNALNGLMATYAGQIRFGITLFPDTDADSCNQDTIPIGCGAGNEAAITTLLTHSLETTDALYPKFPCVTNIDTAMQQAQGEPAFADTSRASYVLLLTDGQQSSSCSDNGGDATTLAAITALHAATPVVPTFVIGFGSEADPLSLGQFADAGGEINPSGPPDYFDAADQASLASALELIANETIGCNFALDTVPPDPSKVFSFFDDVDVPNDPDNGWTYDPATNTVTFHGSACDSLKSGSVSKVQVVFGCDVPVPS